MAPPWVPLTCESSSQITGKRFSCLVLCQRTRMNTQMEETLGEVRWSGRVPLHCRAGLSPSASKVPQLRSTPVPGRWLEAPLRRHDPP